MSRNLVTLALSHLTPEIINRIATALGLDRNVVEKAISAAVPSLFGALSSAAAKPGGAGNIVDAIRQVDTDALSGLNKTLSGGSQDTSFDAGKSVLASMLGGRSTTAVSDAIAKFTNLNPSAAASILGAVAPAVLGTIKANAPGLDAGQLTGLLSGQSENIAAALPSGLSSILSGSGVIDGLGKSARDVHDSAQRTAESVAKAAPSPGMSKLVWIIPLIALAALAWYFLGQNREKAVIPTATEVIQVDGVDVGKEVSGIGDSIRSALEGVTDAATAQAALPKLTEATARVDKLTEMVGKLAPEQKKVVGGLIAALLPALNQLADKVTAMPGVGDLIKPVVDGLRTKLDVLAKA